MPGGLINIAYNNNTDIYLTGTPQITFYKMVYRRYTNFAMESIYVNFADELQFDNVTEMVVPRTGDLIHKTYLHIKIPSFNITKYDVGVEDIKTVSTSLRTYEKIKQCISVMYVIYKIVYRSVNVYNITFNDILNECIDVYNINRVLLDEYNSILIDIYSELSENNPARMFMKYTLSNLWLIIRNFPINRITQYAQQINKYEYNTDEYNNEVQRIIKMLLFHDINEGFEYCKKISKYFADDVTYVHNNNNIRCAWVSNLGHAIIDYIDIYIGGVRIDRHHGVWINVWNELTYKYTQIDIYNKLIGNVPSLTTFDCNTKPEYDLYIPLSFWFNKFTGLSFPLIAMQYNEIHIFVKLKKLSDVFYTERIYSGILNGSDVLLTAPMIQNITNITMIDNINLQDIWLNKGKHLNGHMMIDYIYLDTFERQRYAQSGHEYLIEYIQSNIFDVNIPTCDIRIDFTNPTKELIWVVTKNDKYLPVKQSHITFNNYTRVEKQTNTYFNNLQPGTYHKTSPSEGINMYSFALDPTQHQPTGTCNFSRLSDVRLHLEINQEIYHYKDPEIYPHDTHINFDLVISNVISFIETLDIEYAQKIIKLQDHPDYNNAVITINTYNQLPTNNIVSTATYRNLFFKSTVLCYVFGISLNIIRLIGGYGTLAYY